MQCARCGAQNPDGNLYCQTCGTPLTSPGGAAQSTTMGPPARMAPSTIAPGGFQSAYYASSAAAAPVHRTHWMLIIAGVVALVVLLAGVGTALAVLASRGGNTVASGVGDVPSPTPAVSPSPVASPTSTPNQTGATESNDGLKVPVPAGWAVASKDGESIVLTDPNDAGSVTVASGPSVPAQSAQDNKSTVDTYFKSKYPDARDCPNTSARTTTFNGVSGISWTVCFTLTSGPSNMPAAASVFAGANKSGSVYYAVMVLTRQDNMQSYLNSARSVLQGVVWKLS